MSEPRLVIAYTDGSLCLSAGEQLLPSGEVAFASHHSASRCTFLSCTERSQEQLVCPIQERVSYPLIVEVWWTICVPTSPATCLADLLEVSESHPSPSSRMMARKWSTWNRSKGWSTLHSHRTPAFEDRLRNASVCLSKGHLSNTGRARNIHERRCESDVPCPPGSSGHVTDAVINTLSANCVLSTLASRGRDAEKKGKVPAPLRTLG